MMADTIAAIATAPGQGGIGIIRMSGSDAERILRRLFHPAGHAVDSFESHRLMYGHLVSGEKILDECMAVLMRAPRSYTREDVAEIHVHGGGFILAEALKACLSCGARLAAPGEFTRRAFMNGRIDLSQAEAVMGMISARSVLEHDAVLRQLEGGVASFIRDASDRLYHLQAGLAACVDYPEEISEEEGTSFLAEGIRNLCAHLRAAMDERGSRLIHDGFRVALIGRPNVGKSSLLNALLGEERAIVTQVPGTTRDLIEGELILGGVRLVLTDTAGIRETEDPVERIGVQRTEQARRGADLTVLVLESSEPLSQEDEILLDSLPAGSVILINKSDLPCQLDEDLLRKHCRGQIVFRVSAREKESLNAFRSWLTDQLPISDRLPLTQPRHLDAVSRAVDSLEAALATLEGGLPLDLATVDLQAAQAALGEITGDQVDEKLLDTVFANFCVGK